MIKTSYQIFLEEGMIYGATKDDRCIVCGHIIGKEKYATALNVVWDGKEKFDFSKHVTDELLGYKHLRCI